MTRAEGGNASCEDDDADVADDTIASVFSKLYKSKETIGKSMYYGVFTRENTEESAPSASMAAALRAAAAKSLTNINAEERARRMDVGKAASALTGAIVLAQLATHAARMDRLVVILPLFFALGFVGSAKTGL